jgi:predicted nucleotidyltransferase
VSSLRDLLRDATAVIARQGVGAALVGGLAVSVRTEPRFTRDVDLAVAVADDSEAEQLVQAMAPAFVTVATVEQDVLGRLGAVRLARAGESQEGAVVDLLCASSGIESEIVRAATPLDVFGGLVVPVARTGHLMALKVLSRDDRRPQDDLDLRTLLLAASDEERAIALEALSLIVERGAHRDRDLVADWHRIAET